MGTCNIIILVCVCVLSLLPISRGYKILVVFPIPAGSHRNLGDGYVKELLKAGHEITYITPFVQENDNQNLRQINVADNVNAINGRSLNITALMRHELEMDQDRHFQLSINITKNTLRNKEVLRLLNDPSEKFDLVIAEWMFNDIYCGFSAVFNCPYIWSFPYEPNFVSLGLLGETANPSYTANIQIGDVPPFNLYQRFYALWFKIIYNLNHILFYESVEQRNYKEIFTPILKGRNRPLPLYDDLRYNASFIFGNSHVSLGQAISLPQNYIQLGGYHIQDGNKSLPKDLKQVLDDAKHGVIYFSLGSNLKSKDFPDKVLNCLLKIFSKLKQSVIWKFEGDLPLKPDNVHIIKWAPQQSILAHPNCILFITHGGMLSITEAVHFGVPFIGIPVFYDQHFNVGQSVKNGIAKKVELTEKFDEDLKDTIQELLIDSKYRQRIKEISFIYNHRPVSPWKEMVHWVEHAVRTGGAMHYRSPALQVPWYQKLYLDLVALFVFFGVIIYGLKLTCIKSVQKLHRYSCLMITVPTVHEKTC